MVQSLAFGPLLPGMSLAWTDAGWGLDFAPTPGSATKTAIVGKSTASSACAPTIANDPTQPQEGEVISFDVTCSTGTVAGRGATIVGTPILVAKGDGHATWAPSLSDAGHHRFLAATWTADRDVPPETVIADVDVADAWNDPKNVLVDPVAYEDEWGLPVIHLFPKGTLGADYVPATATFQGHTYAMEAKYRGAASYGYPQKSLTLRFDEKDSIDLGDWHMGHRDHLVLITTFDDNSYVRQKLVYDLWDDLALDAGAERMVPRTFHAVLYVDGAYYGLYTAIDHVDDEFARDMGLSGDGNMYKAVDHNGNFYRQSVYGGLKVHAPRRVREEGRPAGERLLRSRRRSSRSPPTRTTTRSAPRRPSGSGSTSSSTGSSSCSTRAPTTRAGRTATSTTTRPTPTSSSGSRRGT